MKLITFLVAFVISGVLQAFNQESPIIRPAIIYALQAVAQVDPKVLAGVAAALISLALTYIPGVNVRWAALSPTAQRFVWVIALLLGTAGLLAYTCNAAAACISLGARGYFEAFVNVLLGGIGGSVGTFMLSTPPAAVREQKALSKTKAENDSDARLKNKRAAQAAKDRARR